MASIQLFGEGPREGHPTHEKGFWVSGAGLCIVSVIAWLFPLCFWLWEDEAKAAIIAFAMMHVQGKRGCGRWITGSYDSVCLHPYC